MSDELKETMLIALRALYFAEQKLSEYSEVLEEGRERNDTDMLLVDIESYLWKRGFKKDM